MIVLSSTDLCYVDNELITIYLAKNREKTMSVDSTVLQVSDSRKVTIFSLPKAFGGHTGMIQHNAVQSWMRMEPKAEIILMGNDPGVAEYAAQWGLRHCPDIKCNE